MVRRVIACRRMDKKSSFLLCVGWSGTLGILEVMMESFEKIGKVRQYNVQKVQLRSTQPARVSFTRAREC